MRCRLSSSEARQYNRSDVSEIVPVRGLQALLIALALCIAPLAEAEEDTTPIPYQGAYWGVQTHGGIITSKAGGAGATVGPTYGVSGRLSLFASLLDVQLKAMAGHYTLETPDGGPRHVDRLSIGIENHGHPFLVLIIQKRPLQQWLAGLYLSLGLDLDMTMPEGGEMEIYPAFKFGLGSEYPLTNPDQGWSMWLGLSYHLKLAVDGAAELGGMDEHVVELTLGYRNNDIFFVRAPRLDEFDYKNRPYDDR